MEFFSDDIKNTFYGIAIVFLIGAFVFGYLNLRNKGSKAYVFSVKTAALSKAEQKFYKMLVQVVGERFIVFSKIRLADVFDGRGRGSLNQISQKHIDFLLCSPEDFSPILGIELDDSTHNRKDRINRDEFVNALFTSNGLSIIRVKVKNKYELEEIKTAIISAYQQPGCIVKI